MKTSPLLAFLALLSFAAPALAETSVCSWVIGAHAGPAGSGAQDYLDASRRFRTLNREGYALLRQVVEHQRWLAQRQAVSIFGTEFESWNDVFSKGESYLRLVLEVKEGLHRLEHGEMPNSDRELLKTQVFEVKFPELDKLAEALNPGLVALTQQVTYQNTLLERLTTGNRALLRDAYTRFSHWAEHAQPGDSIEPFLQRVFLSRGTLSSNYRVVVAWNSYVSDASEENFTFLLRCLREKSEQQDPAETIADSQQRTVATEGSQAAASRESDASASHLGRAKPGSVAEIDRADLIPDLSFLSVEPRFEARSAISLTGNYRWMSAIVERHRILSSKPQLSPWEQIELNRAKVVLGPMQDLRRNLEDVHEISVQWVFGNNRHEAETLFRELVRPDLNQGYDRFRGAVVEYRMLTNYDDQLRQRLPAPLQRLMEDLESELVPSGRGQRVGAAWLRLLGIAEAHFLEDLEFFDRRRFPADVELAISQLIVAADPNPPVLKKTTVEVRIQPEAGRTLSRTLAEALERIYTDVSKRSGWAAETVSRNGTLVLRVTGLGVLEAFRQESGIHTHHSPDPNSRHRAEIYTNKVTVLVFVEGTQLADSQRHVRLYDAKAGKVTERLLGDGTPIGEYATFFKTGENLRHVWQRLEVQRILEALANE